LAFALVLTALGGGATWVAWKRRGTAAAVRGLAWTLLPLAAWLTGTLRLAVNVASDVGDWAAHLVFSPSVWLGIILAGISVVLFGTAGALRSRSAGKKAVEAKPGAVASADTAPQVAAKKPKTAKKKASGEEALDDDIEAILRRHGIS
jgi:hypothetical protein